MDYLKIKGSVSHHWGLPGRSLCGSQAFLLGRTTDCSFLLVACIASSDTIRVGSQERGLRTSSSSNPPNPVSEVCGVFSSRILISSSSEAPLCKRLRV